MKSLNLRPRYKFTSSMSVEQVMDSILNKLKQPSEHVKGSTLINHAYLNIVEKERNYWSPELHISVEESSEGSLIRGVVGPTPKIWTMFMFFYTVVIALFVFGGALGISQWWLNMEAPWLWSMPAAITAWLIIFGAAKYGQHKGNGQLILLNTFMYNAIADGESLYKSQATETK